MNKSLWLLVPVLLVVSGCASVTPKDYADQQPALNMVQYLTGRTTAWGMAQSRSGEVVRRFRIEMTGVPAGSDAVRVHEHDIYTDGRIEDHDWLIRNAGPHEVLATSDQIVGQASGEQYGNALNLHYTLKVRMASGSLWHFGVSDWFFQQTPCRLINVTYGSKLGFKAFNVVTFFKKDDCQDGG